VRAHAAGARTIVIDNASTDGSEAVAESPDADLTLVRQAANVGFGAAMNTALRLASSETALLLNPDCELRAHTVGPLVAELAAHPECAIVGPRVLNDDGSVQGSVRGDPTLFTGLFGRTSLLTRWFPTSAIAQRNVQTLAARAERSFTADWISGACFLARRDRLLSVNGFDERYFLYWEDADLCRRLRQAGWTIRYVSDATVVHTGGVSSRTARAASIRAFHRSAYVYYATHLTNDPVTRVLGWLLLSARCRWKLLRANSPSGEA
jgi:GT2 family glycosyltransferase